MTRAQDIEERATFYLIRREEPEWSEADQAELDAWLAEAMAHKAAYWRLVHGWSKADRIAALGSESIGQDRREWRSRKRGLLAIAAIAAGILALSAPVLWHSLGTMAAIETTHDTPVDGQKVVHMADGSQIELNTDTRLRTAISNGRRDVWLEHGEAFFRVVRDVSGPFVVHAGNRTITVLGTSFSVRVQGDEVSVLVVEGKVRFETVGELKPLDVQAGPSTLTRGGLAIVRGPETLIAADAVERVDRALAWRRSMLTFDESTLSDIIAEFNGHNARQIIVEDPAIASIRIGGSFRSSNPDAFLRLLQSAYGLQITDQGEKIIIAG